MHRSDTCSRCTDSVWHSTGCSPLCPALWWWARIFSAPSARVSGSCATKNDLRLASAAPANRGDRVATICRTGSSAHPWWRAARWCGADTADRWPHRVARSCSNWRCPLRRRSTDAGPLCPDGSTRPYSECSTGSRWRFSKSKRPCAPLAWAVSRSTQAAAVFAGVDAFASAALAAYCSRCPVALLWPLLRIFLIFY